MPTAKQIRIATTPHKETGTAADAPEELREGAPKKFAKLLPYLEKHATTLMDYANELDEDELTDDPKLSSVEMDVLEEQLEELEEDLPDLYGELSKLLKKTGVTRKESVDLAEHVAREVKGIDTSVFAGYLFHVAAAL